MITIIGWTALVFGLFQFIMALLQVFILDGESRYGEIIIALCLIAAAICFK